MKHIAFTIIVLIGLSAFSFAAENDSVKKEQFTIHAQTTIINQFKPSFHAPYTGDNSLVPQQENKTSVTATFFLGSRLWKGASIYINPEMAGGSGLSGALGIGAATNGETFRIGNPAPAIYLARLFFTQYLSLSNHYTEQTSDFNQLSGKVPERYIAFTIGKICAADYFDNNQYSHDPRTQFMSWALMDNGAWDYPANVRGYTPSIILEYVSPQFELRFGASLVPKVANGNAMNWNIEKAAAYNMEYTHYYQLGTRKGAIRLLGFYNTANMGNYQQAIEANPTHSDIVSTRQYGRNKYGFGLNVEQGITDYLGVFFRASWNDGKNETWMFTEIDRSVSAGLSANAGFLKRPQDNLGLAFVMSGLSKEHREYLKDGGKGFILGDGRLNYTVEKLMEFYYSAQLVKSLFISGVYQLVADPGYNKDRKGPVSVFSVRFHINV